MKELASINYLCKMFKRILNIIYIFLALDMG